MKSIKYITNGAGVKEAVPLSRSEVSELQTIWNANGDIDTSSAGYQYTIDTLTQISADVVQQKFYTDEPSKYLSIRVGYMGWSEVVNQRLEFIGGPDFGAWRSGVGNGESRNISVDAGISSKSYKAKQVTGGVVWNRNEIEQAAAANNWDPVAAKLRALKKAYDLGLQEDFFLGDKAQGSLYPGLIINPDITVNTTLITAPLGGLTATQLDTFLAGCIPTYFAQTSQTEMPDTFVIPYSDYLTLTQSPFPSATGVVQPVNRLDYILQAFKRATQNDNFRIMPSAYCEASKNTAAGLNKQAYLLYRSNDVSTARMDIGVPFTIGNMVPVSSFTFRQEATSKFTGVQIYRPLEFLRFQY